MRSVLDMLVDPVFILTARRAAGAVADFEYRYVNAAGLSLYGRSSEQLRGHDELELFPSHRGLGVLDYYARVFATGEPERFENPWSEDEGIVGAFDTSVVKFRDGLVANSRVITNQTRVERALANATQSLRTFVAASETLVHARRDRTVRRHVPGLVEESGYEFARVAVPAPEDPSEVVSLA